MPLARCQWRESGFSRTANTRLTLGGGELTTWPALYTCHWLPLAARSVGPRPRTVGLLLGRLRSWTRWFELIQEVFRDSLWMGYVGGTKEGVRAAHAWEEIKARCRLESQPTSCLQGKHWTQRGSDQSWNLYIYIYIGGNYLFWWRLVEWAKTGEMQELKCWVNVTKIGLNWNYIVFNPQDSIISRSQNS